ncbi:hypothetical protein ASD15_30850 [Massilia sp. Root351]|uniref:AAA family ATPase n=1 Tax=Massilia sp. Root351 TaxID=1736522 RepID=UPI00070CCC84|nr:AAA family ATPase [Massilia sp. Root351]KQV83927.1 hypothetical protein ASD15_30850 [Massilia sp. Root351]
MFDELHAALPEERRAAFQDVLAEFMQLGKDANQALERAEQQASEQSARLAALDVQGAALEARSGEYERREAELAARKQACGEREAQLLQRSADLAIREENAAAGFLKERIAATAQLQMALEALAGQRLALQAELARVGEAGRQDLDARVEQQLQALRERERLLDDQAVQQATKEALLEVEQRTLQRRTRTAEEVEALLRAELLQQFSDERAAHEGKISGLKRQVEHAYGEIDQLTDQVDAWRSFEATLAGRTPDQILDELDGLRLALRDRERAMRELEALQARDDSGAVRAERDALLEELRELRPELADLRQQNHRVQLGVMEKEHWEREKRLLQKNKELMEKGLVELEGRIRGLTEEGQAQGAFPELGRMDTDTTLQLTAAVAPIPELKQFTNELRERIALSQPDNPLVFGIDDLQLFVGGLAMSQLHVLQGISGTGKTSLAKAFAKVVGGECTDIAVQAGWRDRSDLLGHYNAFEKRYYEKDALQALYRARTPALVDRINVVLLDEMNLSRPEQYFADFLSALEKAPHDRIIPLMESSPAHAPRLLAKGRTILLPENVWFIGTANQDETTNELADKTYDRAFVMELRSRHKGQQWGPREGLRQVTYSFQSMKEAFDKARKAYRKEVEEILESLDASPLTEVLEARFGQSWGNRFERQAKEFLPVVRAAGGSLEMALDHLLATRMFRSGKVTGRYDVGADDLHAVEAALDDAWSRMSLPGSPERCQLAIDKDLKRRERGG